MASLDLKEEESWNKRTVQRHCLLPCSALGGKYYQCNQKEERFYGVTNEALIYLFPVRERGQLMKVTSEETGFHGSRFDSEWHGARTKSELWQDEKHFSCSIFGNITHVQIKGIRLARGIFMETLWQIICYFRRLCCLQMTWNVMGVEVSQVQLHCRGVLTILYCQ